MTDYKYLQEAKKQNEELKALLAETQQLLEEQRAKALEVTVVEPKPKGFFKKGLDKIEEQYTKRPILSRVATGVIVGAAVGAVTNIINNAIMGDLLEDEEVIEGDFIELD